MGQLGRHAAISKANFSYLKNGLETSHLYWLLLRGMLSGHSQIALPGNDLLASVSYLPSPLPTALVP